MSRRPLLFLLSLGVIFGYGGAIASARWHARSADCGDRWGHHGRSGDRFERYSHRFDAEPARTQAAPPPQPQPQTVVVQSPAPTAAAAPQIFFIMSPTAAPQVVTPVAVPVVPAVAASPAPAAP
jgi:hypothetical protein